MSVKSFWRVLVVLVLVTGLFANVESVSAEGAPYPPTLLSPRNGETANNNPPQLCAQSSDPDGNLSGIKFEVNGGGEGDHISPFIPVDGNGVACWQDSVPWSEQEHAWQARAVDTNGAQSGASGQWSVKIQTSAPLPETCTVNDLYADRSAPQTIGTTVSFTVVATCTNGVNRIDTYVDGGGVGTIQGGSGRISWNTNGYGAGNHVFSVQAIGNSGGTAGRSHSYDLVSGASPTAISVTCSTNNISILPQSPQTPGTQISVEASGNCNTGLRAMKLLINGSQVWEDGGNLNATWNTNGYGDGIYSLKILTCGVGDNNCSQADVKSFEFVLKSSSGITPSEPNKAFGSCEAIKIGGDVYVIIKEGSAIQRRHIPNPATLDALGYGQSAINNKGFSDIELKTIGLGSDVPDVVVDPNGFNSFKTTFCPNTAPIISNQSSTPTVTGQVQIIPNGPQGLASDGQCPASPAVLTVGGQAEIAGRDLNLRPKPNVNSDPLTIIPSFTLVNVIDGPRCNQKVRWFVVEYKGVQGWAAEVGTGGEYHMYPVVVVQQEVIPPLVPVPGIEPEVLPLVPVQPLVEVPIYPEPDSNLVCSNWGLFCGFEVHASEYTGPRPEFDDGDVGYQCTEYMQMMRPDALCWLEQPANGSEWAKQLDDTEAKDLGITHDDNPQVGDIAVWDGSCGLGPAGHVGLVVPDTNNKCSDGKVPVADANHVDKDHPDGDGKIYDGENYSCYTIKPCMEFIHESIYEILPRSCDVIMPIEPNYCDQFSGLRWAWCALTGN